MAVLGISCISDPPVEYAPPAFDRQRWRPAPVHKAPAPVRSTVRRIPTEQNWQPHGRRISSRWTSIVIHHSATERGSAGLFDKGHRQKGWDELGYHFVIGNGHGSPDGLIEVGPRWHKQKHGAHCKTLDNHFNEHGIGICLVGDFTRDRPTRRQLASLNRLAAYLCSRCGISPDRITTHGAVTGKTACPGPHFSIRGLRRSVASQLTRASARH